MRGIIITMFSKSDAKYWIETRKEIEHHLIQDPAKELGA